MPGWYAEEHIFKDPGGLDVHCIVQGMVNASPAVPRIHGLLLYHGLPLLSP